MARPATQIKDTPIFDWEHSYQTLPESFYRKQAPVSVSSPRLISFNADLAEDLGMAPDALSDAQLADIFSGNQVPQGAESIALGYAGHQFGRFVPQLGDGRAVLLGEVVNHEGQRRDIQLKGSGQTPFSRRGDGRAALGPVLREYLLSEAMHVLGIPTTRSLAMVTTGEEVMRETPLPGAVLTRVAASHIRVGTFEYIATQQDPATMQQLLDYTINRHYPECAEAENPALAFIEAVMRRQSRLVAQWMGVGFIHGVMNTDNMAISGETIDYGPCAFMDGYDPATVFSSIDHHGRYAFGNQPPIAQWNLARLTESLLPCIDANIDKALEQGEALIQRFQSFFAKDWLAVMGKKYGLAQATAEDKPLIDGFLHVLHDRQADFTLSFHALTQAAQDPQAEALMLLLGEGDTSREWLASWRARLQNESPEDVARLMRRANPVYIPRNHRVEQAIDAAVKENDFTPMRRLQEVLAQPFDPKPEWEDYQAPPKPEERVYQTFCGT